MCEELLFDKHFVLEFVEVGLCDLDISSHQYMKDDSFTICLILFATYVAYFVVDYSIVRVKNPGSRARDNIVARSRDFHGNRRKETRRVSIPFFHWRTAYLRALVFFYGLLLRL